MLEVVARRCSTKKLSKKLHKIHRKIPVLESLSSRVCARCFSKWLLLKILQISQESTWVGVFFNNVADPQNCNFIKKRLLWNLRNFKNTLFYLTSSVADSDSFRFPACNFIKKEIPTKMFFCEFRKISKNIFWQNNSRWLLLKFICEFWEVFQNISFVEHLWETAYFKYKLQY